MAVTEPADPSTLAGSVGPRPGETASAAEVADLLAESRARTLALVDVDDDVQRRQIHPLMSPLVWDLAHIGNYEELWLLRMLDGRAPVDPSYDDLYNAFEHPRWERPSLPILGPVEARAYVESVRDEVCSLLARADLSARDADVVADVDADGSVDALLDAGFVYGMVIQHEHQHDETLLATHQLRLEDATAPTGTGPNPDVDHSVVEATHDDVALPGGTFTMGTSDEPWAYDNERPAHAVIVAPFRLDRHPVTNAQYVRFIEDGGYSADDVWSASGRSWRDDEGLRHPQFWRPAPDDAGAPLGWEVLRFGEWRPLHPDEPVQHVCYWEADAYARWAGRRLPTEHEWELAASWSPEGAKRRWPWGDDDPTSAHANLGQRHPGPSPVGAHPLGANPWGVLGLIGDVWEWTATPFGAHPGFRSFPYKEYSEVFFGDEYRVLRGGSWATHPVAVRATFRNWDFPIRRQIFCGFRTARDA